MKTKTKNWQKRFNKKFGYLFSGGRIVGKSSIKDFFSTLLDEARDEERNKIVEIIGKLKNDGQNVYLNEAVTEILYKLSQNK